MFNSLIGTLKRITVGNESEPIDAAEEEDEEEDKPEDIQIPMVKMHI